MRRIDVALPLVVVLALSISAFALIEARSAGADGAICRIEPPAREIPLP